MNEAHEVQRLADYLWEHHNAEAQAGDLNNDSTATTAIRLLDRLREAEEVAEAVEWLDEHGAVVEFYGEYCVVTVFGGPPTNTVAREQAKSLPAAVAALRARVEGKRAPEGDAEKGE